MLVTDHHPGVEEEPEVGGDCGSEFVLCDDTYPFKAICGKRLRIN